MAFKVKADDAIILIDIGQSRTGSLINRNLNLAISRHDTVIIIVFQSSKQVVFRLIIHSKTK